jgi:hypothetical protein
MRALGAIALLLFVFVSAPIGLAGNSPDVCAMACCVEDGYCCCIPRRPFVEGQAPDGKPALSDAKVASRCPEDCVNSTASTKPIARKAVSPAARLVDLTKPSAVGSTQEVVAYSCLESSSASPRAPPLVPALPA